MNTLILGAGAAGLMCAAHSGPGTLLVDHAKAPGEKIRISGGGRCNFTNLDVSAENFHGENPHFPKSALARYTQWDFITLLADHGIAWHEKTLGQMFCDDKATRIVDMFRDMLARSGATLRCETRISEIGHNGAMFTARLERNGQRETVEAQNLVIATGGKSIPRMGATGMAYDIAQQFGHTIIPTRPALVPFTFPEGRFVNLAGLSLPVRATAADGTGFDEALLFTHRGLSGPAILQVSSYWRETQSVSIDLLPQRNVLTELKAMRAAQGRKQMATALAGLFPARLANWLATDLGLSGTLGDQSNARLETLASQIHTWSLVPSGTEGYRTAEVTAGGVDTAQLSSQSMASQHVPNLYFIGECVDVTGWLGGYNFQWAWSSAMAAARAISARA